MSNLNEESLEFTDPFDETEVFDDSDSELEKLLDIEIPSTEFDRLAGSLSLPKGKYTWIERPKVTVAFHSIDKEPTDIAQQQGVNAGRCSIIVSGMVQNIESPRRGWFQFQVSPDWRSYKGEPDFLSKGYALVVKAFFIRHERNPKSPKEIRDFLSGTLYVMTLTQGKKGGNFLGSISFKD